MKYSSLFMAGVFLVLFAGWYMPVSFFNVFVGDDFWHGTNVGINGFWGAQLHFYQSWEGSFTHTFLATVPHVFSGRHVPFAVNILTFVLLALSVCFFIKVYCVISHKRAFLISLFLTAFYYATTGCGAEIRFWVCSSGPYLFGVSTLLIFMACYHRQDEPTLLILIILWACQLLIVGNKVPYIICLFTLMVVHDAAYESFSKKKFILFYLPAALFSLINIVAPGNYLRLHENMQNVNAISFGNVLFSRFGKVVPMFFYAFFMPSFFTPKELPWVRRKFTIIILVGIITFFLIDSLCMYFCFRDSGPLRALVLSEICFFVAGMVVRDAVVLRFNLKFINTSFHVICFGLILCVLQLRIIKQVPSTVQYAQKSHERNRFVRSQFGAEIVCVPELPSSHLLLSYFANDIIWIKNVYLPYFCMLNCDVCVTHWSKE